MFYRGQKVTMKEEYKSWHFPCNFYHETTPKFGVVYTIRNITSSLLECQGLQFVEIVNPRHRYVTGFIECSWAAFAFAPVITTKTDISILEKLKNDINRHFELENVA